MNLKNKNGLRLETGGSRGGAVSFLTIPLCAATVYALAKLTGLENVWLPTMIGALAAAIVATTLGIVIKKRKK